MGKCREVTIYCFRTFSCACKVISIVSMLCGIAFLIAGIVLLAKNPYKSDWKKGSDDSDDLEEENKKYFLGVAFFALGVFVLICSIITSCCAFQFGIFKRCLQDKGQTVTDQSVSQPQSNKVAPSAYPPNATHHQIPPQQQYPPQEPNSHLGPPRPGQPPRPLPQLPPSAMYIGNIPPSAPPSYEDVVNEAPTAPPAEEISPKKL